MRLSTNHISEVECYNYVVHPKHKRKRKSTEIASQANVDVEHKGSYK